MKTLATPFISLLFFTGFLLGISSCQKESVQEKSLDTLSQESLQESSISYPEIPERIIRKINRLPFLTEEIGFENVMMPNGDLEEFYIIEKDIMISEEQMDQMIEHAIDSEEARHYRTLFTVSTPQTITIRGVTSGSSALSVKQRQGLLYAVNNYKALPITLGFTISFGAESSSADINVKSTNFGSFGPAAVSGYPNFFGDPFSLIRVNNNSALSGYSNQKWEQLLTHEIGHALGLRHTDWFNKQSCGLNVSEGSGWYGAIWIPGTAMGNDSLSIMNNCLPYVTDGEFDYRDKVALESIY